MYRGVMLITCVQLAPRLMYTSIPSICLHRLLKLQNAQYKASLLPMTSRRQSSVSWNTPRPPSRGGVTILLDSMRVRAHLEVTLTSRGVRLSATKLQTLAYHKLLLCLLCFGIKTQEKFPCDIYGFHSIEYQDCCLTRRDAVYFVL
jgi:hypothetical protein